MEHDRLDLVVVDEDALHDLGQQLAAGFADVVHGSALLPVSGEILQQVAGFNELVVIDGPQRLDFALQLLALGDVLFGRDEALFPAEVDPLDRFLDLRDALQRLFVVGAAADGGFDALAKPLGNGQVGKGRDHLLVDRRRGDVGLFATEIAPVAGDAAVLALVDDVVPPGAHLAEVLVFKFGRFAAHAAAAKDPVVQQVDADGGRRAAGRGERGPHFLAEFEELVGEESLMFALKPLAAAAAGLLALAQRAAVESLRVGHAPGVEPVLQ